MTEPSKEALAAVDTWWGNPIFPSRFELADLLDAFAQQARAAALEEAARAIYKEGTVWSEDIVRVTCQSRAAMIRALKSTASGDTE